MVYLFVFAHPDDESVACAGTIKQLRQRGDNVVVVSVTDGGAGELEDPDLLLQHGVYSMSELRRRELLSVARLLDISHLRILHFADGAITNQMVWGELKNTLVDLIDEFSPDCVVTFDHTGWYFHLDHVGVSIATTLAVQQATHKPDIFLLSHYRVNAGKWKYIFPESLPITHVVDVTAQRKIKQQTYDLHASQELLFPKQELGSPVLFERYQLAFATRRGKKLLAEDKLFSPHLPKE